jgi:hypothetical protein
MRIHFSWRDPLLWILLGLCLALYTSAAIYSDEFVYGRKRENRVEIRLSKDPEWYFALVAFHSTLSLGFIATGVLLFRQRDWWKL